MKKHFRHIDNDIFGLKERTLTPNRNSKFKNLKESLMTLNNAENIRIKTDNIIRDKSPFINGKKNKNYIPPHHTSQISIGNQRNISELLHIRDEFEKEKKEHQNQTQDGKDVGVGVGMNKKNSSELEIKNQNNDSITNEENTSLCNNCYNDLIKKQLQKVKPNRKNNKQIRDSTPDKCIYEYVPNVDKKNINSKIKARDDAALSAYSCVMQDNTNNLNKDKNKFINSQEQKTFYLNENSQDLLKVKALENYNKRHNALEKSPLSRLVGKENSNTAQYYEKYVGLGKDTSLRVGTDRKKNIENSTDYKASLNNQIFEKTLNCEKEIIINRKKEQDLIEKSKEEDMIKNKKIEEINKKHKDDFINENMKIISSRSKKENAIKEEIMKDEANQIKDLENEMQINQEKEKNKKVRAKMNFQNHLDKQIEEKNMKILINKTKDELEKIHEKPILTNNCGCDYFKTCNKCKKKFHTRVLIELKEKEMNTLKASHS